MSKYTKEQINRHIKTHSERSIDDVNAIAVLQNFLRSGGKINPDFTQNDKWPNIDGRIELVSDPSISRRPNQNFFVQIKGTSVNLDVNETMKYQLKNLAFPAFVYSEVTLDPCILFVVLNPSSKGKERVFWKYMSVEFLTSLNFENDSATVDFNTSDEIIYNDEATSLFADKLTKISSSHSFVKRLELTEYTRADVVRLIKNCDEIICEAIDRFDLLNDSRDNVSKRILTKLDDLCSATLLLNSMRMGHEKTGLRLSWELSLIDIRTKFLGSFLQSLRYIGKRIPEDGQSERLILRYYNFLWQIRKYFKDFHRMEVLKNLQLFPLHVNQEDEEYYKLVACSIDKVSNTSNGYRPSRYYVQNKTPFYIGEERYFEVTLQLAGIFATKFNRITVYTKENISTNYSVQIGYTETDVKLWKTALNNSRIKVVTDWKVSIDPSVLNKFSALLGKELKLSSTYGEYGSLMDFLTRSGINLLDLIDLEQERFDAIVEDIYEKKNTAYFKEILILLKQKFSEKSIATKGRNVIRYILLRLREDALEDIKRGEFDTKIFPNKDLQLTNRCIPFDINPLFYNLPNRKTNNKIISKDVIRALGLKNVAEKLPYIFLKHITESTGEIYSDLRELNDAGKSISSFNSKLTDWDRNQGHLLKEEGGMVCIEEYGRNTLAILQKLLEYSRSGNDGQKQLNSKFIKDNIKTFTNTDEAKKHAIENAFVDSKVLMIYGAAGTGKTTLIDFLSDLMQGRSKLFLAKTHTALERLKRVIKAPGQSSNFVGIDKFLWSGEDQNYDIVFVDECSIIDNRKMLELLKKIGTKSLLVLAGDNYQIESIDFGNWFFYAKNILDPKAVVELSSTWRTTDESLKSLWDEVRYKGPLITEKLVIDGPFSENINEDLFIRDERDDEIVLCLNYDGRFGLNNINNYFQDTKKTATAYSWQEWSYKVGDPILFNDTRRFPRLYNNLKGRIVDISTEEGSITFTIEIPVILTNIDIKGHDLSILSRTDDSTIICFTVYERHGGGTEEEREKARMESIVPFQLAYAVSIHKSQGLEYDSVKIVIPSCSSERISHGIFYTAITRAKKKLKIFWSSETMTKIIGDFKSCEKNNKSLEIVKKKLGLS